MDLPESFYVNAGVEDETKDFKDIPGTLRLEYRGDCWQYQYPYRTGDPVNKNRVKFSVGGKIS